MATVLHTKPRLGLGAKALELLLKILVHRMCSCKHLAVFCSLHLLFHFHCLLSIANFGSLKTYI